jgi:CelD/BcsL family acetyltransferase involved in cellulose biosynthesis
VASRWDDVAPPTPFQHPVWFQAWYPAFAGTAEPLIVEVTDGATGAPALLLPLIRRRQNGLTIIEFADCGPYRLQRPAARPGRAARGEGSRCAVARSHLRIARIARWRRPASLPQHADRSCGPSQSACPAEPSGPCALNGNILTTGEDYDAWRYTLEKTVRKELERSWRVFTREVSAKFSLFTDEAAALRILSTTEVQQGARMERLGLIFILNDATCAAFYRNLVRGGLGRGYVVVSALTVGEEVVATLLGIRQDARYTMIRISNAGEKWSLCSPGRLMIERTMAALHKDGVREFDFSIGNYAYKRRFGVKRMALADADTALSWRGLPYALRDRAVRELRRYPKLAVRLKRALGRPLPREEG